MIAQRLIRFFAFGWLVGQAMLAVAFRHLGETQPAIAALLYLPPAVWLLPAAPLGLVALVRRDWVSCAAIVGASVITLIWIFGYVVRLTPPSAPAEGSLIVSLITHNTGQAGNASLLPFKNHHRPDFLLLQDAPSRARRFCGTKGWEEFTYAEDIGEFTLASKYPIIAKALVQRPPTDIARMKDTPIAARFEVEVKGQRIAIYNVHAFSPREYLGGGGVVWSVFYGVAGFPGTRWATTKARLQAFWDAQIEGMKLISERAAAEVIPCIVAGDMNAPPLGVIHRELTKHLQDVHEEAGSGCGFTFPGITRNPLSRGGPWLRIDRVLATKQWQCIATKVEPHNPSQHRALAATLALPPAP